MTKELKQSFTRRVTQANRTELLVILYEMTLVYIKDAIVAFDGDDKDSLRENIRMARECIGQLRTGLNFDYSLSKNLFAIYSYADRELAKDYFGYKKDNLDVLAHIFTKFANAYTQVSKNDTSAPLMSNAQSVYSGLTYGKSGIGNETLYNSANQRGFLI